MFKITKQGSGFHMTFDNGYTISVQWGFSCYSDNYEKFPIGKEIYEWESIQSKCGLDGSKTVEIAIFGPNKHLIEVPEWKDQVKGYIESDEVLKWMNYAAALPKEAKMLDKESTLKNLTHLAMKSQTLFLDNPSNQGIYLLGRKINQLIERIKEGHLDADKR